MIRLVRTTESVADDRELLRRVAGGDVSALGDAFDRWHRDVYAFVTRVLGSSNEADDIVQSTFIALPDAAANLDDESSPRGFVLGVALQMARRERRKFSRRLSLWRERSTEVDLPTEFRDPELAAVDREELARFSRSLARLSDAHRDTIVLVEIEGLRGEDAARALGVPVNTIWTRLHHARAALKESMERENSHVVRRKS
jgi:RNA polymerase sigma factor (sigma-70 family)